MVESRAELLAWLNDLLQLNYTRIEEAGTGAAYCQIMDAIFGDVHMSRVKFDATREEEYLSNYKILQSIFKRRRIEKIIEVERLMKLKVQDNLEFLQWCKRFWDMNAPDDYYDAVQRRGNRASSLGRAQKTFSSRGSVASGHSRGSTQRTDTGMAELKRQNAECVVKLQQLEKERDFYFGKLLDIEMVVQETLDRQASPPSRFETPPHSALHHIQTILYKTEDGFEVPDENEGVY